MDLNLNNYKEILQYIVLIIIITSILSIIYYFINIENFAIKKKKKKIKENRRKNNKKNNILETDNIACRNMIIPLGTIIEKDRTFKQKDRTFKQNDNTSETTNDNLEYNYNMGCWKDEHLKSFQMKISQRDATHSSDTYDDRYKYEFVCCGKKDSLEPSEWSCSTINDKIHSIRKNSQGNIECASDNGIDCKKYINNDECNNSSHGNLNPKICNANDYNDVKHWCSIGYQELLKPLKNISNDSSLKFNNYNEYN